MEDALARFNNDFNNRGNGSVLILVVMEDALAHRHQQANL